MKKMLKFSGLLLILIVFAALILLIDGRFSKANNQKEDYLHENEISINENEECKADYVIIDRFEGNFAVCENKNGEMVDIDKSKLPKEAKEGSVLIIKGDKIEIDYDETENKKNRIKKLMDLLWK